jgi:RNA polymerase sigma factor (sigma-70 family)
MPVLSAAPCRSVRTLEVPYRSRPELSDEELLAKYRGERSQEAFSALVDRHGLMVIRLCRRILGNAADAEDVAQAVFLLLAHRPELVRKSVAGWLCETAKSRAINELRSKRRRLHREERAACRAATHPDHSASDMREELGSALSQLRTRIRQAVVLRYVEGRSVAEAAQAVGCPPGTIGRRSMEGLRQLRSILSRRAAAAVTCLLAAFTTHTKLGIAAVVVATGVALTAPSLLRQQPAGNVTFISSLEEIPQPNRAMTLKHWAPETKLGRAYVVTQSDGNIVSYASGTTPLGQFVYVYTISTDGEPFYLVVNGTRIMGRD